MANYLPVLLVSVTAGMPDDASLQPLPRGQVDYLSHDWAEEDVWRSWRSMTKQKHEIANGVRLENASWRTWMKQRNKLKTVSPETLNWLKDSDVTWLYGPLHTAVDWSPPPKPAISPPASQKAKDDASAKSNTPNSLSSPSSSTNLNRLNQANGRLGFHSHDTGAKKPILKHRSIAEMLTSALPPAPLWAEESSEFAEEHNDRVHEARDKSEPQSQQERLEVSCSSSRASRPPLFHTKSDTNILTRFARGGGPKRASPPRGATKATNHESTVIPQAYSGSLCASQRTGASNNLVDLVHSGKNPTGASSHLTDKQSSVSPLRTALPLESADNSGASAYEAGRVDSDASATSPTATAPPQKKHISFNAIVEQCIAIDSETAPTSSPIAGQSWTSLDEDGYVEDTEDGLYEDVGTNVPGDLDDSEDGSQAEAEDEDEVLEIKPSSRRNSFTGQLDDSQSSLDTQRSSSMDDPLSSAPGRPRIRRASSSSGKLRRSRHSASSGSGSGSNSGRSSEMARSRSSHALDREHVTIAPIAPTILKTGGVEDNEDGVLYVGGVPYSGYGASHSVVYATPSVHRGSTDGGLYGSSAGYGYGYGGYGYGESVSAGRNDAYENFERGTEAGELVYQSPNGNVYPWGEGDAVRFRMQTEYDYAGSPPREYRSSSPRNCPSRIIGGAPGTEVREVSSDALADEVDCDYFDAVEHGESDDVQAHERDSRASASRSPIGDSQSNNAINPASQRDPRLLDPGLSRERTPSPDFQPKINPRIASLKYESGCRSPPPASPSSSASDIAGTVVPPSPSMAIPTPGISPAHQEEYSRMRSPPESPVLHAGLLSPDMSPRGRSLCSSPISGSATSSSVLRSGSRSGSESRSESRGRSRTRNSSLNSSPEQGEPERGRSRSRSSASAAHSPLSDSSSPQSRYPSLAIGGIGIGLGIGGGLGVPHSGREVRDGHGERLYRKTSEDFLGQRDQQDGHTTHTSRGRNREGRRISESLSPPFLGSASSVRSSGVSPPSSATSIVGRKPPSAGASDTGENDSVHVSKPLVGSSEVFPMSRSPPSTSGRSVGQESTENSMHSSQFSYPTRSSASMSSGSSGLTLPPSIPEEDERQARSIPDSDKRPEITLPASAPPDCASTAVVSNQQPSGTSAPMPKGVKHADDGSGKRLANRTADLVSSARTFLGNIWNLTS